MNLLKKSLILLVLIGFYAPSYAAVDDIELASCGVYSDADEKGDKKDDKKEDEEEPDCE
jgi:hypothetical protein